MLQKNTTKKDGMDYEDSHSLSRTKKSGMRVVTEMSNMAIVGYFIRRNGYPISVMLNLALFSYLAWDKVLHIFF